MEQLLTTKLFIPPTRPDLVLRPRLIKRLNAGLHRKLTLISAPAGFGKTTLVTEWLDSLREDQQQYDSTQNRIAWLSLDEGDNDLSRFMTYFVAALKQIEGIEATFGKASLALLQSPQPPPIETTLTSLINEISATSFRIICILDDYHLIEARPIQDLLYFLLEHQPKLMHLVIATREDPHLPLSRLRARDQLTELRAKDLSFTSAEAVEFLNQIMDLDISAEDIATLVTRTEGWITGLQLAAISLQGRDDTTKLIESFSGSHRLILDYLIEEVLSQQTEKIQMFLLQTAILDRLTGHLCDALTGQKTGRETLEALEQANLFIIPLDEERCWYRYHHLFAQLLRQRLHQSIASLAEGEGRSLNELRECASVWYEDNGLEIEAFQHAATANDIERAARLAEGDGMPLHTRGALTPVLNWLESLPTTVLDTKPSLWVIYGSALLLDGQLTSAEEKLQTAETVLQDAAPDDKTNYLLGLIASSKAALSAYMITNQPTGIKQKLLAAEAALKESGLDDKSHDLVGLITPTQTPLTVIQHQVEDIIVQSRRALEYLPPDKLIFRIGPTWLLGVAYQLLGDRAAASQAYTEAISLSQSFGATLVTIPATIGLGNVQETENQLYMAAESYRRGLQMGDDQPLPVACEAHLGLARIFYEWNDLEAAQKHWQQGSQLARRFKYSDSIVSCEVFLARLKLAQGDVVGASDVLAQVEQYVLKNNFVYWMPEIAAEQVLLRLHQGNLPAAANLAKTHELPLSKARVHFARGAIHKALALLESYRQQMEDKNWEDERLKAVVLQAVALHIDGKKDNAAHLLGKALSLAEPGGFIRIFVDEGPPMAELLKHLKVDNARLEEYISKILAAFDIQDFHPTSPQPLIDPLSERELEILQLIAEGLTNPEIASKLYLSINTVKVHTRNIYSKLVVNNRTEAGNRARELGIIPYAHFPNA